MIQVTAELARSHLLPSMLNGLDPINGNELLVFLTMLLSFD